MSFANYFSVSKAKGTSARRAGKAKNRSRRNSKPAAYPKRYGGK